MHWLILKTLIVQEKLAHRFIAFVNNILHTARCAAKSFLGSTLYQHVLRLTEKRGTARKTWSSFCSSVGRARRAGMGAEARRADRSPPFSMFEGDGHKQ